MDGYPRRSGQTGEMPRLLALGLCALTLVACSMDVELAPSAGTIVYVKGTQIRSIELDGSHDSTLAEIDQERTIRDMAVDAQGERIAFVDDSMMQGGAPPQIVVMNTDGTQRHVAIDSSELPDKTWNVWEIAWSPRQDELALCLEMGSFVFAIDGSSSRAVGGPSFCVTDWSEDGSRLLGSDRAGVIEVAADGSDHSLLIEGRVLQGPTWSPDESEILYRDGRTGEVRWISSDGADPHPLGLSAFSEAAWSPDGTRIVFVQGFDLSMATMNISGDDVHQILPSRPPDNGWPQMPAWLES